MKHPAVLASALFLFTACAGAVNSNPPANPLSLQRAQKPIQASRSDVLAGVHHLYAGYTQPYQCSVAVYDLPLTKSSKPSTTLFCNSGGDFVGLAIDEKYLYVMNQIPAGQELYMVSSYAFPVSKFESPSATITLPKETFPPAISAKNGYLYVVDQDTGATSAYAVPLTNGESPSVTGSLSIGGFEDVALAGTQYLYVNPGYGSASGNLDAFALPFTNNEAPTVQLAQETNSMAQYATTLYVASGHTAAYAVYVYSLPLTPASKPKVVATPAFNPHQLAVDEHNLFVTSKGNSPEFFVKLRVYKLPLVSNETGFITLSNVNDGGIVVGP